MDIWYEHVLEPMYACIFADLSHHQIKIVDSNDV